MSVKPLFIAAVTTALSALVLTAVPIATAAHSCPPMPAKERVSGYVWLNKQLSVYWKVQCEGAAAAGPRLFATRVHISSSDPTVVARWLASHADISSDLDFVAGTNPIGLKLMRPRIRGFLYDALLTGFRVRGKP
jgi:hypothetical protein